jgi:lambda family phage portal protein
MANAALLSAATLSATRLKASASVYKTERGHGRAPHAAADLGMQSLLGWAPPNLSADAEWLYDRDISTARIRDLLRNDGWGQAIVDRQVDMAVGANFRLSAKPDALALGISQDQADELATRIEVKWRAFAEDPTFRCDAERMSPFAGIIGLACRELVGVGEALGVLRWLPRENWPYATAIHIVDADRLSNPHGQMDSTELRGGVALGSSGEPIGYHIRRSHPGDVGIDAALLEWDYVSRFDNVNGWERPKVLHCFERRRPGQHRGISRLAAALVKMRLLNRYSESEVKAAAINGSIIGAIYTQLGAEYSAEILGEEGSAKALGELSDARGEFYGGRRVLDDAKFITMFPTDRLDLNTQPRQVTGFPQFQTAFLQAFAASIGISYEQLSMDWSRTNYSSARAALNEVWRSILRLRANLIWGYAQPIYTAWLEDAFDTGEIDVPAGAPDFYDAPAAYVRADWIGPPRGYVDPVKEAQAALLRRQAGLTTLEKEVAEQGGDMEQTLQALARENKLLARYGIRLPAAAVTSAKDEGDEEEANAKRDERAQ